MNDSKDILNNAYQICLHNDDRILFATAFSNISEELCKLSIKKCYIQTHKLLGYPTLEMFINIGDKILLSMHFPPDIVDDKSVSYSITVDGQWIIFEHILEIDKIVNNLLTAKTKYQ